MAIHTDLPIHRTGVQLLQLAFKVQEQMPRGMKRTLGEKINDHCVAMLDLMALANASQKAQRRAYIEQLMQHLRATSVLLRAGHDSRYIAHSLWADSVQLLDSIGRQGGGWLKSTSNKAPAA
jgi:hypothetical protein